MKIQELLEKREELQSAYQERYKEAEKVLSDCKSLDRELNEYIIENKFYFPITQFSMLKGRKLQAFTGVIKDSYNKIYVEHVVYMTKELIVTDEIIKAIKDYHDNEILGFFDAQYVENGKYKEYKDTTLKALLKTLENN